MRLTRTILGIAAATCLAGGPTFAQHGHAPAPVGHGHVTSPSATSHTSKTTTTAGTPTLTPIAAKISVHPQLLSRVNTLLEGTGLTLDRASTGFRNQGQFLATLHVSKNLNNPVLEPAG